MEIFELTYPYCSVSHIGVQFGLVSPLQQMKVFIYYAIFTGDWLGLDLYFLFWVGRFTTWAGLNRFS